MNFSTNQVNQLYVLDTSSAPTKVETAGGLQYIITHADGKTETTDLIKNVIGTAAVVRASADVTALKELEVAVANVVAGEEYIISLPFRGFGQEDVVIKTISAKAKSSTASDLYEALAKNAWVQRGVEVEPLYDLYYDNSGTLTKITSIGAIDGNVDDGFVIREAKPFWKLGSFPETLPLIEVGTSPIVVSGVETNEWLVNANGDYPSVFKASAQTLPNTHKIADFELFCKGERGNSDALAGWPDNIAPDLYVDASNATGYAVLAVHYAFVGSNDEVQKSERDAIFITKDADYANLSTIADAVNALNKIA